MSSGFIRGRQNGGRGFLCSALLIILPAAALAADPPLVLDTVGGNSASNELLWLDFDGSISAVQLNDDASTRSSLRSFDFFKNTCEVRLDVVAADTNRGELLLYPNGRGSAEDICATGPCPTRPDGISFSDEELMAVADTGTAGTVPAVWLIAPAESCPTVTPTAADYFAVPRTSGQILVDNGGGAVPVPGISDTEFVSLVGGGLDAGDLLILTSNPTTLSRLTRSQVEALKTRNTNRPAPSDTAAEIILGPDFFGSTTPTAMAFIPGTGGVGSSIDGSRSEDLLVTLTGGTILKLRFETDGAAIFLAPAFPGEPSPPALVDRIFLDEQLGNGPLGIAAGVRDDFTYVVVADRQQGAFLRFPITVTNDGQAELQRDAEDALVFDSILTGVQNPQGAAINSDVIDASKCVDIDGTGEQTGCRVRKTVDLHYTQLEEGTADITDTVIAQIRFIDDPRGGQGGELTLDNGFTVPDSCRGLPLPDDDAAAVLVLIEITKNFEIKRGEFVQAQELADLIIPQLDGCKANATRIFYHPDPVDDGSGNLVFDTPEGGVFYDSTIFCSNPSKSLGRDNSPLVICSHPYAKEAAAKGRVNGKLAKAFQNEINVRADNLEQQILALDDFEFGTLKPTLIGWIDAARAEIKRDFIAASEAFDAGANAVFSAKTVFENANTGSTTDYGDLLGRFLSLAFFSKESAGQQDYYPPQPVCSAELTDVACAPGP